MPTEVSAQAARLVSERDRRPWCRSAGAADGDTKALRASLELEHPMAGHEADARTQARGWLLASAPKPTRRARVSL
jgi:hypothetical protein